jgi:hypothetical protein
VRSLRFDLQNVRPHVGEHGSGGCTNAHMATSMTRIPSSGCTTSDYAESAAEARCGTWGCQLLIVRRLSGYGCRRVEALDTRLQVAAGFNQPPRAGEYRFAAC